MNSTGISATATPAVEPARSSDRSEIIALWDKAGLVASYNDPGEDFDFALGRQNSDVLVVRESSGIVASALVGHDGHRGWLYYVAVHPDHQRRGLGAIVVEGGEEWLKARGVKKVMLLVRETNTRVVKFYENLAYETVPRTLMQKWLTPPAG